MDASIGYQPSYAWRSMFSAKNVIEKGARWSIGDGQKVLSNQAGFKICSPNVFLAAEARVSELIDTETKIWKRDLIRNVFSPFEAKQILNIPLSWRLPADKRIWH